MRREIKVCRRGAPARGGLLAAYRASVRTIHSRNSGSTEIPKPPQVWSPRWAAHWVKEEVACRVTDARPANCMT